VLRVSEQVVFEDEGCLFLGKLGRDGALRHTNGILPMVALARDRGIRTVFVPATDAQEAALVEGVTIIPVASLSALIGHLRGDLQIPTAAPMQFDETDESPPGRGLCRRAGPGACQARPGSGRGWGAQCAHVMRKNQYMGAPFSLDMVIPAPVDHTREQVLDALRACYAEYRRPASINALAQMTHRCTRTVMEAVQDLVAAGMARRLGRSGKLGVIPMVEE
jgi:hypothetical protein